jgi:hypothetical protein
MNETLPDDDEPLAHSEYLMSARLSILYQIDLTNRNLLDRERANSLGRAMTREEYASFNELSAAASRTKKALDAGRDAMRKTWTIAWKHDVDPCPAPIAFTAEDYLSSLMVVDSMATCADVEKWYPPLVRDIMFHQDFDGGLRIQEPVVCRGGDCLCERAIHAKPPTLESEFDAEAQCCPAQGAWCSRDRTFITAAGTMILLAETPYRAAFLSQKAAAETK